MAKVNIGNIKIIIGLGNPGKNYQNTYHNVGQIFISWLIKKELGIRNQESWNIKHKFFLAAKSIIHDSNPMIHIVKPLTFMNGSGKAVEAALQRFRIKPAETLIVHDDSDIKMGKYKLSFGRGGAGHKGVESIINSLGTKNFWRLRIGIGRRPTQTEYRPKQTDFRASQRKVRVSLRRVKAGELVLKQISKRDIVVLQNTFKNAFINMR